MSHDSEFEAGLADFGMTIGPDGRCERVEMRTLRLLKKEVADLTEENERLRKALEYYTLLRSRACDERCFCFRGGDVAVAALFKPAKRER